MFAHTMRNEEMIFSSDDYEIKAEYFRQAKYCRKVNILQCGSTTFSCVTFAAVALIQLFKADDMSIYKKQPFMHDIWYPFLSIENHMGVVVFTNLFVVCQGACFNSATQCTFIGLMIYSSMRFRLLHIKIKKFGLTPQENPLALLEELIVEHQDLLQFVKTLNERTKYVMLLEFLLNAVSLASGLLQLVMIKTITQLFSICAIILLQLIQIFVLAWSANEISVASLSIADAVATSNWIGQALMVKKLLLIVLMRAQVPVGLTAGPFFNMSTVTAVNTLKAAYTYVSFMMRNLQN
ncbi:hypothetical protein ABEB36_000598 [Hypothenemus hampei]|uniref:Uncharacterized protein n=1 Tax=Hypothenemus hampei TaxID=57062 RepID=A0ABD1FEE2_HYPHA